MCFDFRIYSSRILMKEIPNNYEFKGFALGFLVRKICRAFDRIGSIVLAKNWRLDQKMELTKNLVKNLIGAFLG